MLKLHLGCGQILLPGWKNVDAERPAGVDIDRDRGFVRLDLTRDWLWLDDVVDFIFCEHFIEHLTYEQGQVFLDRCRRSLKPGGVLRVVTPDLAVIIDDYHQGRLDRIDPSVWAPKSSGRMVNEAMRLWGHQFIYDGFDLATSLMAAGFTKVDAKVPYKRSEHAELVGIDQRPYNSELIMEAIK